MLDFRTEDMVGEFYLETMDDFVVHRKIFDLEDQRGTYREVLVCMNSNYIYPPVFDSDLILQFCLQVTQLMLSALQVH